MLNFEARETSKQTTGDFPGARETSKQMVGDFPKLGKRLGKQRDEKQETIYNHFNLKKHFYYGKRK